MSRDDNRGISPLWVALGMVAGAVGGLFFAKKENRNKAVKVIKKASDEGKGIFSSLKNQLTDAIGDIDALNRQNGVDTKKTKQTKTAKKK